jgi:hypothetical protein
MSEAPHTNPEQPVGLLDDKKGLKEVIRARCRTTSSGAHDRSGFSTAPVRGRCYPCACACKPHPRARPKPFDHTRKQDMGFWGGDEWRGRWSCSSQTHIFRTSAAPSGYFLPAAASPPGSGRTPPCLTTDYTPNFQAFLYLASPPGRGGTPEPSVYTRLHQILRLHQITPDLRLTSEAGPPRGVASR